MKTVSIVGARPQFIKGAILSGELEKLGEHILINTGQHYDINMAEIFFEEFRMKADYNLKIGSGSHGVQTAHMLEAVERLLMRIRPNVALVYGDTNTTLAGALAAAKLRIPLAHVEAGLRSYNRMIPEEINRVVSDHVSDILFAPTEYAMKILTTEGINERAHMVGDVMIQLMRRHMDKLSKKNLDKFGLESEEYILCTLHSPENVDIKENLVNILKGLTDSGKHIIFPIHPRTKRRIREFFLSREVGKNIHIIDPVGYVDMLTLMKFSEMVITDSGGVQKEAFALKRPCVTTRNETEWIETVDAGWNTTVGTNPARIAKALATFRPKTKWKDVYTIPNPAERICEILKTRVRA
jgi:UDP-N-acetylglucosamine 2-epimerase